MPKKGEIFLKKYPFSQDIMFNKFEINAGKGIVKYILGFFFVRGSSA
jgi:hypothetical protein